MVFKPNSTYRIQFHKEFTLKHLEQLIPYYKKLGVSTIYASPIFAAIPGSTHGYDGVNPHQINPEIGTEAELIKLTNKLKKNGINWIQDIVPNHMSFHPSNTWLMDVLEKWKQSAYFDYFDLNFTNTLTDKRLMVPFLGEELRDAIRSKSVQLVFKENKLFLSTGEHSHWPLNLESYSLVSKDFNQYISNTAGQRKLAQRIIEVNTNESLLLQIADSQYYRLCHWQETEKQINYRRFFIVNSLICLNMDRPEVFDTFHSYIIDLVKRGVFQGVRIDHIDGLADPGQYLARLRDAVGPDLYIVVEKILAAGERVPQTWPVEGNTGYDFLAVVNNTFTNKAAEKPFTSIYKEVNKNQLSVAQQIVLKKKAILFDYMQGELDHLVSLFLSLNLFSAHDQFANEDLKDALADFLVYCKVYRFYGNKFPFDKNEQLEIKKLIASIPKTDKNRKILSVLENALLKDKNKGILSFYQRCMQFSGPLMAKGVEDTLMYTYNRFVGHTEVGDAPDAFGLTTTEFHELMAKRLKELPYSMNGTATHDTKRGEDVRARLNVLSDIPDRWISLARKLLKNTLPYGFHQNDAYLIFQTVLGAMPFNGTEKNDFEDRMMQYVEKALREAKKRSNWASPNEQYENEAKSFAVSLLDPKQNSNQLLHQFLDEITDDSIINSLSQLLLKFTCPGIPDVYQGTELWDLSLVDPDNRRAVDYELRKQMLAELDKGIDLDQLWAERKSGKIKLWLTQLLLQLRANHQSLFNEGSYIPIQVSGSYKKHVLAYLRNYQNDWLVVVIPLGLAGIGEEKKNDLNAFDWKDTALLLPDYAPHTWENLLTGKKGRKDILSKGILMNSLTADLPFAMLKLKRNESGRTSGILMPIFSLPSKFGIGDLGPEAHEFINFLAETRQQYWQLLPLNPASATDSESPYSAYSSMAGHTLFISPELLMTQGLLKKEDLKQDKIAQDWIDYPHTRKLKEKLIKLAYKNFIKNTSPILSQQFSQFCELEGYWLTDFSLFIALRNHHQGMPWNKWPKKYKTRDEKAINLFINDNRSEIEEINWQQFIFHQQWQQLRAYAEARDIRFIGDLPFYVAYDSCDVWANQEFFKLDDQMEMECVSGVPPDGVTENGQRWGMPIFDWERLKKEDYSWWIQRIKRNIELFDIVRIDHFRAFHSYWEIPAEDETAKNGKWVNGPGASLLTKFCNVFSDLPFVVEDLGEDMEGALELRDKFKLAGMKVLQFAFGEDMPESGFLPHNFDNNNCMVYVGTHDNNTAKGWFKNDLQVLSRKKLNTYASINVGVANVHFVMMNMAISSTAKMAILQIQDLLGLDESARMNTPGTITKNWMWRMKKHALHSKIKEWLLMQTLLYGRG